MTPLSRQLDANGLRFDLLEWAPDGAAGVGAAATVVALHGFPQTPWAWEGVGERLAGRGLRVLAPAQRGYSPGARPQEVAAYTTPALGSDVLALCDSEGLDRVHLLGHDWGASVGWWLVAHYPERFRSFTALSVPHTGVMNDVLQGDPDQQQKSSYFRLFWQEGKAEDVLLEDDARRLRAVFEDDVPGVMVDRHMALLGERSALTGALNWYRAMSGKDSRIGPVAVPVTYIWGAGDPALGRVAAERSGEGVTADYRFVEVPDAGHWLPECEPALIADEVVDLSRRAARA